MSKRKEYRVGEIFRHYGETYKCVTGENVSCKNCAIRYKKRCMLCNCSKKDRSDRKNVNFIRVTEPEEGMLFRASDGKLYELKKLENFECGCYIIGYTNCTVISYEAFGEDISDIFHWYPVEEKEEEMIDYSKIDLRKVYMRRHLELAVVTIENDIVTFKVADQFYFGDEFSKQEIKSEFKAKNGATIRLEGKLEWDEYSDILILRRFWNLGNVNETTKCNVRNFADIMEAVNEYNETNGKGYEKPWPQYGDSYFYIASRFEVASGKYGDTPNFDKNLFDAGNFFRTRKEAEAALERVKKALKGEE